MSVPKRGLGRGLGALLGDAPRPAAPPAGDLRAIAVGAIRPNPRQPRKFFDPAALDELASSVRELGVLVPLIVRDLSDGQFELIAGERRWRAAAQAGLATVPALVRPTGDGESLEIAIVENLQRADLDALEEAMGYQHLIDEFAFTQERVAERVGKGRPTVANALRLLGLSDAIKSKLRNQSISATHARALLALPELEREAIAERIEREGWTARDVERYAQRRAGERAPKTGVAKPAPSPDVAAVESRLRYALGAPVAIVPGARGGRLEIRYADDDDLTRIVDQLLPGGT